MVFLLFIPVFVLLAVLFGQLMIMKWSSSLPFSYVLLASLFLPLILIGALIYLFVQYVNYCKENHCPILTYRQIKKFYAFNPDVWQITHDREEHFTLIQYDGKTVFVKSFFGYWLTRIFINRSKKISKKNNDDIKQIENTQNLLKDIRVDIERRKEESDAMIKLCEKEIQEITLRLQNENKQKEGTA